MRNILIEISFDGTKYHGWQVQKNGNTIQAEIQKALCLLFHGNAPVIGCSRTDAGVHAHQYYCTTQTESVFPTEKLTDALNGNLPQDISVLSCKDVPLDFHPRYDAISKEYVYQIWSSRSRNPFLSKYSFQYPYSLDIDLLNKAAKNFEGTADFSAFMSMGSNVESTVRTIYHCQFIQQGNLTSLSISANGFLYNMVRIIVGTLLEISAGKITHEDIIPIILSKDRNNAGPTAPALGLALYRVNYHSGKESEMDGKNN